MSLADTQHGMLLLNGTQLPPALVCPLIKTNAKYAIINLRYTAETKEFFFAKELMMIKIAYQDKLFDS